MTKRPLLAICLCISVAFTSTVWAATDQGKPILTVKADRPNATYSQGEKVVFLIKAIGEINQDAELDWKITKDGVAPIRTGKVRLVDGTATVSGSLNEPGFLLCTVYPPGRALKADGAKDLPAPGVPAAALAGAAIDPLQIKPSMPVPDDFDAFWKAQKQKLAAVPMNPRLTPVPGHGWTNLDCFDVQVDCAGGAPVSGYLARPRGAQPKSLPIILLLRGAGVTGAGLGGTANWAEKGLIAMEINAHGIANDKPARYYNELGQGALKGYSHLGRESREKSYFLGMFLRVARALDFLTAQPEWDGRTLIAYGSSQGGFQAFAASGLDERVTFIAAGVPAGCDHTGVAVGRVNGWPKLVPNDSQGIPDPAILEASRYLDCVNFASRSKAKGAFVTVGFIDQTCPPTTVYAAYNNLRMPKAIFDDIPTAHANSPEAMKVRDQAVMEHVKVMRQTTP